MRIGDQRISSSGGGFQPACPATIAQVASGDRTTLTSQEQVGINRFATVGKFIRSKLSRRWRVGWDLFIEREDYEGKNFLKKEAIPSEVMTACCPLSCRTRLRVSGAGPCRAACGRGTAVGGGVGTFKPSENEPEGFC